MFRFAINTIKEINPWQNIKILHTNIKDDILAGITVGIIALPLALAFGEISRLGPVAGIWGAIAGGIIGGIFGGCMVGVSGPTAPKAAQIATFMGAFVIGTTDNPDLVAAFSIIFLSGLILIIISIIRISKFIHYIPYPVVAGFMCGIGIIVILTQINAFVGLESAKNIPTVLQNLNHTIQNINIEALYVAIPSLTVLFSWDYLEKKYKFLNNIPSPLVALIIGTSIAYFMSLNIPYIGDKMGNTNETEIFSFYLPDLSRLGEFLIPALALAGLAILDSLLSCKVADNMTNTHHSSDRETFGQGMANIAAGLLGGVTTATATMRTVANIKCGAKTPLASITHGVTLLAILSGLGFLVSAIPTACLAAILFKVGIDILDYRILPIIRRLPMTDLLVFIIVLLVTVYQDLMIAVAIGVLLACFRSINDIKATIKATNQYKIIPISDLNSNIDMEEINEKSISVLQLHGPLFFGSTELLIRTYAYATEHTTLIIDINNISKMDLSGVYALEDLVKNARAKNIKVFIFNNNSNIKKILKRLNFIENIGQDYYKDSRESIILAIQR